jgi:ADP-heptose:LPS heptosyltransferase
MNLVLHQAALGDFVLMLPLLERLPPPLTVVAPGSHLAILRRRRERFGRPLRLIDVDAAPWWRLHDPAGAPDALDARVRGELASAERIVSFVADAAGVWVRNAQAAAPGAEITVIRGRPPAHASEHAADHLLRQAREAGLALPRAADPPKVRPLPSDRPARIAIHPGSGGGAKCRPLESFSRLGARLAEAGLEPRFVVGPVEAERIGLERLRSAADGLPLRLCRRIDDLLDETAEVELWIGNDAGPSHLAAWSGIAVLAIFGPTDPAIWAPRGPAVEVVAPPRPGPADTGEGPSDEEVREAGRRLLSRLPVAG